MDWTIIIHSQRPKSGPIPLRNGLNLGKNSGVPINTEKL